MNRKLEGELLPPSVGHPVSEQQVPGQYQYISTNYTMSHPNIP